MYLLNDVLSIKIYVVHLGFESIFKIDPDAPPKILQLASKVVKISSKGYLNNVRVTILDRHGKCTYMVNTRLNENNKTKTLKSFLK